MNFQNCRVNIFTNRINRRSKMVNILTILNNVNGSIKATLLRLSLINSTKRYCEKVLNPEYIHNIREAVFNEGNNEAINYLGMVTESFHNETRAYVTERQVNLQNLDNNHNNYYIITISQEYFDGLMA